MELNLLFQMGIIPVSLERYIIDNSFKNVEFAADKYQKLLLKGMVSNNVITTVVNSIFVNSFPRGFKKIFIPSFAKNVNKKNQKFEFINTSFINLWGIRHLSKYYSIRQPVINWLRKIESSNKNVFIGYSAFGEGIDICNYIKKRKPNVSTCLILPDLPQCCLGSNKLYNRYLQHISRKLEKSKENIDKYILFSKHMAEKLEISTDNYIVVEGICDETDVEISNKEIENNVKTTILYTGALEKKYGVDNLLEAFCAINNKECELHICGSGTSEDKILLAKQSNSNIVFHGKISNTEAIKLQKKADILVNPRQNHYEFTKYSFPSKTMEYLLSGTPMIGYKLDGIPDEYDDYILYVKGSEIVDLTKAITKMIKMENNERKEIGMRGRNFIIEKKGSNAQAKRIIDFLER